MLLSGPPGLGKTTLAQIVAREMGVGLPRDLGPGDPARRRSRRAPHQSRAARRAVHRRDPPPRAGGRGDPLSGDGGFPARSHHRRGAGGALGADRSAAFHAGRRDHALGPHHPAAARALRHSAAAWCSTSRRSCVQIVARGARVLGMELDAGGAAEIARRSRGTPRVAARLLRRVRDFAAVAGAPRIDAAAADAALQPARGRRQRARRAWTGAISLCDRQELRRRPGRRRDRSPRRSASSAT